MSNLGAYDKIYDGTTAATLNTASAMLAVVVPGDVVTLDTSGATATFAQANVGTAIPSASAASASAARMPRTTP